MKSNTINIRASESEKKRVNEAAALMFPDKNPGQCRSDTIEALIDDYLENPFEYQTELRIKKLNLRASDKFLEKILRAASKMFPGKRPEQNRSNVVHVLVRRFIENYDIDQSS